MKVIEPKQIDALMPFLDKFEDVGFSPGTWKTEAGHFPWFNSNQVVMEFIEALYANNWVMRDFDWIQWRETAQRYIESGELVESADVVTIQKLLTTHARADRFCEGHFASMFESGHLLSILRRLQVLRAEMDRKGEQ